VGGVISSLVLSRALKCPAGAKVRYARVAMETTDSFRCSAFSLPRDFKQIFRRLRPEI
jgi:hypothetical protein